MESMGPKHTCHAIGCREAVPPKLLMCKRHWEMVPQKIRTAIVVNFNPDQCRGRARPSLVWLKYAREAINYVQNLERAEG